MTKLVLALPALPGKSEEWRRFIQEMLGLRRNEYEQSRSRLGISGEMAWLSQTHRGEVACFSLEVADPSRALSGLSRSQFPFDCWYREKVLELHGLDLSKPVPGFPGELIFEWQKTIEDNNFPEGKEQTPMSVESNKQLALRLYEAMNDVNLAAMDELLGPDFVNHDPGLPPMPPGPDGFKEVIKMIKAGFPDGKFTVKEMVAEGDFVTVHWIIEGTHQGKFVGVPATGKHVSVNGTVIQRIENGKSVEHWAVWDVLGLLTQLGAIPAGAA